MLCTECTAIEDGNKLPGAYAIRQPYKCKVREANIVERLFSDKNISLQKQWHATVHTFNVNSVSKPLWQNPMTSPLSFSELRAPLTESELCAIHTNVLRAKNTCNFEQSQTAHCTLSHAFIQTISYILDYIYINVLYYIILYTIQYTEEVTEDFETLHSPDARSFCRIHCECCHLDFNGTEIWESRCTFAASSLWPRSCSRRVEQCLTRATRATRATRELL